MRSLNAETMRRIDRTAITERQIPGMVLMENAGAAVAGEVMNFMSGCGAERVVVLAGKGNNGGDALVAARLLAARGISVEMVLAAPPETFTGDAATAWTLLNESGFRTIRENFLPRPGSLLVDGLLGTGISGSPRGRTAELIDSVNTSALPVLAIDLPSGLNADSGAADTAVHADLTVTLAAVKSGMLRGRGPELCGRIVIADIGIPEELITSEPGEIPCFGHPDAAKLVEREAFDTFKNRRGTVAVIGGAPGYTGAAFLAGEAALRAGAGLVRVWLQEGSEVFGAAPRALIVHRFRPGAFGEFPGAPPAAVAVGPGLGTLPENKEIIQWLAAGERPLLLDADALNLLSHCPALISGHRAPLVLTPHPGEYRRLAAAFGLNAEVPRPEAALALAAATAATVVLKGPRTICAAPDGRWSMNLSGSPALATAGSGDVLSGAITALLASGMAPWDATRLGVWLHGTAGELLRPCGSRGVIADDLPASVGRAWKQLRPNA